MARGRTVHDLAQRLVPCLTGRTVRACAGVAEFAGGAWISLPGGTRRGGEVLGLV
jgi:hypothetical protein